MDREWNAFWNVVHLPVLAAKQSTIEQYVDRRHATINWPGLTAAMAAWSHGEQILLRAAHALYNGGDELPVSELERLDPDNGRALMAIIQQRYWGV